MEDPNGLAVELVDEAIDFADVLRIDVRHLDTDATVLDFGVEATGGLEAGLLLAEIAAGGLATLGTRLEPVDDVGLTHVEISTDHPATVAAAQSPGWDVGAEVEVAGPAQLLTEAGRAKAVPAPVEPAGFAVAVLATDRLPGEAVSEAVATEVGVPTSATFLVVAPPNSQAGALAASARVAERTVGRLGAAGLEPAAISSVTATAPVAPIAARVPEARARSMAAIAGGGRATVVSTDSVSEPASVVGPDGAAGVGPAQLTLDVIDGPVHAVGGVDGSALAADLGL